MAKTIARVLCGLLALLFIGSGLLYMFNPAAQLGTTMLEPLGDTIFGLANARANLGAPLVTFGILLAMGAILQEKIPLRVVMIYLVLSIIARIVGLATMGVDADGASLRLVIVNVIMLAIAAFGHQMFGDRHAKE